MTAHQRPPSCRMMEELEAVTLAVGAEEVPEDDEDEDDDTTLGDIDRINRVLGVDGPWANHREYGQKDGSSYGDSDVDSEIAIWDTKCVARASGFLDVDDDPGKDRDNTAKTSANQCGAIASSVDGNAEASTIGSCDLSQDIQDMVVAQSESSLENCLHLNRVYQEFIVSAIDDLEVLLLNNKEKQKYVQDSLNQAYDSSKFNSGSLVSLRKQRVPYFKGTSGVLPPPNEDSKIKASNQELPTLMRLPRLWSENEISILEREVEENAFELILQPIMARREILLEELEKRENLSAESALAKQAEYAEKETQLKALKSQNKASFISESRDKDYDWMKISVIHFNGERSPRDCELYWKNYVHPSVFKSKWSKEELANLKNLVETHGLNNWDVVAQQLETNRLPVQCAEKHLSITNRLQGPWSIEEKNELVKAVETCRIGDYIPFNIVAHMIEGRTSNDIWRQWTYNVDPSIRRGKWSEEEDTMLLTAVWLLGARNWFNIKNFVKSRTDVQCCDRWKNCLDPSLKYQEFTRREDRRLLEFVEKHGKKWAVIGKELGRTDNRCAVRYKSLIKYKKKTCNENARLGTLPRKEVERHRNRLYSNVAARLEEISHELGLSLSYIRLRRNFKEIFSGNCKLTVGEVKLGEHLKKCHVDNVIEVMKQKPGPIVKKMSAVERGIQEFFQLSLKRRHPGRPPRIWDIEDGDVVYPDAVHELHRLLLLSGPNRVPVLPPMTTTMQAFRNMLLMRNRLISSKEGANLKKDGQANEGVPVGMEVPVVGTFSSGMAYSELFGQFAALFAWPALLSAIKPFDEPPKPPKAKSRKRGRKRTLGEVKDTEFKCFAKPTPTGEPSIVVAPTSVDDGEQPRKRGRPLGKSKPPVPQVPTRRSARTRNTDA